MNIFSLLKKNKKYEKEIYGFKVLDKDMRSPLTVGHMKFELGVEYTIKRNPSCLYRGYHYYERILDCISNFGTFDYRIFKCKILGKIDSINEIRCTNKIILLEEVTKEEISRYILENLDMLLHSLFWQYTVDLYIP